jgi:hypothetical protein
MKPDKNIEKSAKLIFLAIKENCFVSIWETGAFKSTSLGYRL